MIQRGIHRFANMPIILLLCYLATIILRNVHGDLEHEIPRTYHRSILSRRAIDGSRGRKFFDPEEEGTFDSYGSAGGQYDYYKERQDHTDIRMNVPGEPGIDYPAYTILPQTSFSCEGRLRGYYADEVAGCQVFHVCHDILVSSFLCPVGSIFSQKLLTCDWWSKVDCSMTRKFIEINSGDYNQEDDDELIRKAYTMMGLQTGRDVTSDELVDPDRGGRIIDRVTVHSTVNDLPSYREHVPRFLPDYNEQSERSKPSTNYQNSFYSKSYRGRPRPYQDSPIVHIRRIGEEDYQRETGHRYSDENTAEKSGKMINEFQPSYAPTVPTVTTTTRRFYSPTIPITTTTTYRPFTLAYNRFDQEIESSDHLYTHSEEAGSFFTASTGSDAESESKITTKRQYNDSNPRIDRIDDEEPQNHHRVQVKHIDLINDHHKRFDARDSIDADASLIETYSDDIETKESIGFVRAFNGSNKFRIHVQDNSYGTETTKVVYNSTKSFEDAEKSDNLARKTETTVPINYNTQADFFKDVLFAESTTPSVEYSSSSSEVEDRRIRVEDNSSSTTTLSYDRNPSSENILTETIEKDRWDSTAKVYKPFDDVGSSYPTENPRVSTHDHPFDPIVKTDIYTTPLQPDIVLKPPDTKPLSGFRINVPDYPSTIRVPVLPAHYITYRDAVEGSTQLPGDEHLSGKRNPSNLAPPFKKDTSSSIQENGSILERLLGISLRNLGNYGSTQKTLDVYKNENFAVSSNSSNSNTEDSLNNFPIYSMTPSVQDDSLTTSSPLITQREREENNSAPSRSHRIEIVKSIEEAINYEPNIGSSLPPTLFAPANNTVGNMKSSFTVQQDHSYRKNDTANPTYETVNFSNDQNKAEVANNANALSVLQLMAELFKIDHIPRPFALNGFANVKSRSNAEYEHWNNNNNSKTETKKVTKSIPIAVDTTDAEVILPSPRNQLDVTITPRNYLKNQQRIELDESEPTEKSNQPLLFDIENLRSTYELPHIQRSISFKDSKELEELPVNSTTAKSTTSLTTTTTTESVKTIVETEFVPSIGFSFDTNEGRQQYIDAVLGGLLYEPIHHDSDGNKNESVKLETTESSSTNTSLTKL